MPATAAKYAHAVLLSGVIPAGEFTVEIPFTHNLAKQHADGVGYDYVDPDIIHAAPVVLNIPAYPIRVLWTRRPVTPNGVGYVAVGIKAAQAFDIPYYIQVSAIWWHSVQTDDHVA